MTDPEAILPILNVHLNGDGFSKRKPSVEREKGKKWG
jgi:hypothetical protein